MSVLSASASGATTLILLQVASRGLTFAVSQILLRFLSPELLGLSAQLDLYSITVLYFARESIRVAAQRQRYQTQPIVNLSYISVLLGVPLASLLGLAYYHRDDTPDIPYLYESLLVYGVSCFIELLSEPAFVAVQQKLLYRARASSETIAGLSRCFATCGSVIWASRNGVDFGVLPFAIGQLAYSLLLLIVYVAQLWPYTTKDGFSMLPRQISGNANAVVMRIFPKKLLSLSFHLFIQNSFKYVLTQGDGLLSAALASLRDQGTYALASNYGGLIARLVFQPIEESSRNLFAKVCPASDAKAEKKSAKQGLKDAQTLLLNILKLYSIMSMIAWTIGDSMAPILLRLVAGSRWADTEASAVLSAYAYYVPFLAINGIVEAFVAAAASKKDLHQQSLFMGTAFVAFAGSSYLFLHVLELGGQGLVYANCINMALRIVFNAAFISKYFSNHGEPFDFWSVLPSKGTLNMTIQFTILRVFAASKIKESDRTLATIIMSVSYCVGLLILERDFIMPWAESLLGKHYPLPRSGIKSPKNSKGQKDKKS